jgi:hypothetical protein
MRLPISASSFGRICGAFAIRNDLLTFPTEMAQPQRLSSATNRMSRLAKLAVRLLTWGNVARPPKMAGDHIHGHVQSPHCAQELSHSAVNAFNLLEYCRGRLNHVAIPREPCFVLTASEGVAQVHILRMYHSHYCNLSSDCVPADLHKPTRTSLP